MAKVIEQIVRITVDGEETRAEVVGVIVRCKDCGLFGRMCETDPEAYCSEARWREDMEKEAKMTWGEIAKLGYNQFMRRNEDLEYVVRCKDCKHRDPEDKKCDNGHFIQWQLPRDDDWFCADGEREEREDAEDIPMEYFENGGI